MGLDKESHVPAPPSVAATVVADAVTDLVIQTVSVNKLTVPP